MKKFSILFAISLLSFCGRTQNRQTLRIDPKYARGGNTSQIFDSVTYFPLETTEESVFGDIQNMQVSRHYFTFYDTDTKAIFIFDKNGNFQGKISEKNLNNTHVWGQYFSGIDKFTLNPFSERIFIVYDDGTSMEGGKELAVFNAEGRLLHSKRLSTLFNKLQTSFSFIDSSTTIFTSDNEMDGSKYYFYIIKDFDSVVASVLPNQQADPMSQSYFNYYKLASSSKSGSIWSRRYDNTIYHFCNIDTIESFKVVLPQALSLDSSFYKDSSIISNLQNIDKYLYQHRDKVSYLSGLFYLKKLFFFGLLKYNTTTFKDNYFYNLSTGSLFQTYAITPDSMCYFLPLFTGSPVGVDDAHVYSSISSLEMFKSFEANKAKNPDYPPVLRQYFATQTRKSNPVIVQLKPKNNL